MKELSFFIMPTDALKSIHNELESVIGENGKRGILYRSGNRCGKILIEKYQPQDVEIYEFLYKNFAEVGLGRIKEVEKRENEIIVKCEDTTEALSVGKTNKNSCDFTRGYISGVLSALLKKNMICKEEKCISNKNKLCVFKIYVE